MKVLCYEQALAITIQVDHRGERETYSQSYPTNPHQKRIHGCIAHANYPHQYNTTWGRKVQQGNEQSSRHNIQTHFGSASTHHQG